jgi:ElaB/YqjD/DUF883 family membrane-anchored ribosome-binding protein
MPATKESSGSIRDTVRDLVSGAEDLLDSLGKEGARRYGSGLQRIRSNLDSVRANLGDYSRSRGRRLRHAARYANDTVHEHPWTSSGSAFVLGAIVGAIVACLMMRR